MTHKITTGDAVLYLNALWRVTAALGDHLDLRNNAGPPQLNVPASAVKYVAKDTLTFVKPAPRLVPKLPDAEPSQPADELDTAQLLKAEVTRLSKEAEAAPEQVAFEVKDSRW